MGRSRGGRRLAGRVWGWDGDPSAGMVSRQERWHTTQEQEVGARVVCGLGGWRAVGGGRQRRGACKDGNGYWCTSDRRRCLRLTGGPLGAFGLSLLLLRAAAAAAAALLGGRLLASGLAGLAGRLGRQLAARGRLAAAVGRSGGRAERRAGRGLALLSRLGLHGSCGLAPAGVWRKRVARFAGRPRPRIPRRSNPRAGGGSTAAGHRRRQPTHPPPAPLLAGLCASTFCQVAWEAAGAPFPPPLWQPLAPPRGCWQPASGAAQGPAALS